MFAHLLFVCNKKLLDISAVAMARYEKPEPPTQVAQLPDLDIVMVIKPPLSLPTQNVLAYLAGYLLKKISVNECIECQEQLIRQRFHSPEKDTAKYQFLDCKTYGEGYLIYPSATMITFVENLEKTFCATFYKVIYTSFVLVQLSKSGDEYCQFLKCQSIKCSLRLKSMIKLYMKVRLFHALKQSNIPNVEDKSGKHNRKMLKISHL